MANQSVEKFILVVGIIFIVWGINSIFTSFKDFFKSQQKLKDKPIDSYIQVIMIFVWLTGTFAVFAVVSGITFWEFLTLLVRPAAFGAGSARDELGEAPAESAGMSRDIPLTLDTFDLRMNSST